MPLLEKAYAKYHGAYGQLEGGFSEDAVVDLTGGVHICLEYLKPGMATPEFWARLRYYTSSGCYFMTVSKYGDEVESKTIHGVLARHAYSVLDCVQTSNATKLIKIRNPWGQDGM